MLYLAIPAHNEVATIGVLLWRIRSVLAEFPREYEVVVYDDASSDETAEVAEQYANAMPVTVLRGTTHVGYAGALDALIRHVSAQTRYPRRDAMMLLQGDFTDPPGIVPEFARRFEGGADLVVGERLVVADAPIPVRRLFKAASWVMKPFVRVDGVRDLTASMRLIRISALRDLVRQAGNDPVCVGDSWTANADLLLKLVPLARRVESVPLEPTYGVRMRDTRRIAVRDGLAALSWAWGARGRRAVAGSAAESTGEGERRPGRGAPTGKRRDEPELSVEKLRERVRERPRVEDEESFNGRREGRRRERERARAEETDGETSAAELTPDKAPELVPPEARAPRAERAPRTDRPEREKRERAPRADSAPTESGAEPRAEKKTESKAVRPERLPRGERAAARSDSTKPPRRSRDDVRSPYSDPSIELDDPFAAPASKRDPLDRALGPSDAFTPSGTPLPALPEIELPRFDLSDRAEADADIDVTDVDATDGDATEGETIDGAAPRKKRRRNRRSRRGRARKEGATDEGDESSSDEGDEEGADVAVPIAGAPPRSLARKPAPVDGDDTAALDEGDDAIGADESDEDSAARARRRGRRGRRGGARRSRGRRDKDGGDAGEPGDDAGSDSPAASSDSE